LPSSASSPLLATYPPTREKEIEDVEEVEDVEEKEREHVPRHSENIKNTNICISWQVTVG
jgi:hypothetical protein